MRGLWLGTAPNKGRPSNVGRTLRVSNNFGVEGPLKGRQGSCKGTWS